MILPKKAVKNYRRYHGYDYSRGATLFITISTEPRQAIFGRVVDDRIELNAFGLAAEETFRLEEEWHGTRRARWWRCARFRGWSGWCRSHELRYLDKRRLTPQ